MPVLLMHQTIVPADAIGHDIREMYRILSEKLDTFVFGEYVDLQGIPVFTYAEAERMIREPGTLVIYHHSIHWPAGERLLEQAGGQIVFRYHNITPPGFFAESRESWMKCAAGREQTYRYAARYPSALWLSASRFNLREAGLDGIVSYQVVPPFAAITDAAGLDFDEDLVHRLLDAPEFKLFFVSRFAPNKGHRLLVEVVREYRARYGSDIRLYIAGKRDEACPGYFASVMSSIAQYDLQDHIEFLGAVSNEELGAYFLGCDAYVCCSEHEGFCVPAVEAQSLSLPVVARAKGAVPETLGPGQLLFHDHPGPYAEALHHLRTDSAFRRKITAGGRRNVEERFTLPRVESLFLNALSGPLESAA